MKQGNSYRLQSVDEYVILKSKKITPKDHTDRFRILQSDFPALYSVLDRIFPIYRDTYSLQVEKDKCEEIAA